MKIITALLLCATPLLAQAPTGKAATKPTSEAAPTQKPAPPDVLGAISEETVLTLQLIESREDALMAQKKLAIEVECARFKLDASKNECYLDIKTGAVKKTMPPPPPPEKPAEPAAKK